MGTNRTRYRRIGRNYSRVAFCKHPQDRTRLLKNPTFMTFTLTCMDCGQSQSIRPDQYGGGNWEAQPMLPTTFVTSFPNFKRLSP